MGIPLRAGRLYYGWVVVALLSANLFVNLGLRASFPNFFKFLLQDLTLDRASLSLAFSINVVMFGLAQPFLGRLVDERGPRAVMLPSALLLAASFWALSMASQAWQLYLFYGVLGGIGFAGTGIVIVYAIVSRWFVKRRGTALGLVGAGNMAGQLVMAPFSMYLVLAVGWQRAYAALATLALMAVLPIALGLVRNKPEDLGLLPDGGVAAAPAVSPGRLSTARPANPTAAREQRMSLPQAMKTKTFWLLAGGFGT